MFYWLRQMYFKITRNPRRLLISIISGPLSYDIDAFSIKSIVVEPKCLVWSDLAKSQSVIPCLLLLPLEHFFCFLEIAKCLIAIAILVTFD